MVHQMKSTHRVRHFRTVGSNRLGQLIGVRVKGHMLAALGQEQWELFAREARQVGNVCFVGAFVPDKVTCSGTIEGTPCPVAGAVELKLSDIHADHT